MVVGGQGGRNNTCVRLALFYLIHQRGLSGALQSPIQ
jgi:hypothetical protein